MEVLSETLGLFGAEVIEPLLAIARDRTLARYAHVTAVNAARAAAVDDPALRARISVVLREVLADCLTRADNPEDDDVYMVTSLVMDLVEFDDPLAQDLIHAAYESGLVRNMVPRRGAGAQKTRRSRQQATARPIDFSPEISGAI